MKCVQHETLVWHIISLPWLGQEDRQISYTQTAGVPWLWARRADRFHTPKQLVCLDYGPGGQIHFIHPNSWCADAVYLLCCQLFRWRFMVFLWIWKNIDLLLVLFSSTRPSQYVWRICMDACNCVHAWLNVCICGPLELPQGSCETGSYK